MTEMHLETSHQECYKNLLNCALTVGKMMQSEKTGLIHYYPNEEELGHSQTIPMVENVLFSLALFKTHCVENIQEGKQLLKKLLYFQIGEEMEEAGNFPVFLHEYPFARDPATGLYLLAPFYWIIKLYGHVIGMELKGAIELAVKRILLFTTAYHLSSPYPYFLAVRLACAQVAFGLFWNDQDSVNIGQAALENLKEDCIEGWSSTTQLGDLLVGLTMVYPSLSNSPWQNLWSFMEKTWHIPTGTYIGPWIREWQRGDQPKPNLYDLFASLYSGSFAKRTLVLRPFHLQGVLISPALECFNSNDDEVSLSSGCHRKQKWVSSVSPIMTSIALEKKGRPDLSVEKTYTPLSLLWGDLEVVHTLVCQGGRYPEVSIESETKSLELIFTLDPEVDVEDRERKKEIEFFIDTQSKASFTVDERSSTTFELGKPMYIHLESFKLQITFDLIEGEGDFLGHLMRGNRPSQTLNRGEKNFHAYDWTFFIRTIRRSSNCKLKATIMMVESSHPKLPL